MLIRLCLNFVFRQCEANGPIWCCFLDVTSKTALRFFSKFHWSEAPTTFFVDKDNFWQDIAIMVHDKKKSVNLYLMIAPTIPNTGPSKMRKGPVRIRNEHHMEPTIPKCQDTTFMTRFVKLAKVPVTKSLLMFVILPYLIPNYSMLRF